MLVEDIMRSREQRHQSPLAPQVEEMSMVRIDNNHMIDEQDHRPS